MLKTKRILLSFILCSGILGIVFSCCRTRTHWDMEELSSCSILEHNSLIIKDTINTDTLDIALQYSLSYHIASTSVNNPFINGAYATSCDEFNWGKEGIQDPIHSFNVICNSHNTTTGNPSLLMNDHVLIEGKTLATWLADESLNNLNPEGLYTKVLKLVVTQRPPHGNLLDFEIEIVFDSGRVLNIKSDIFTW